MAFKEDVGMNGAEDLFRRIMADPKTEIEAMVKRRESEDTWLDFKAPDKEGGGWAKVRDLFSKAVAGFGNTDGGVIIWGITTKKKKNLYGDMVDAADGFSWIPDPVAVSSGLDNDVSRVTFPAHPGVVNKPLALWENESGVVVTYVPLCPHRPLQRALEGTKDFLMRAGDSFTDLPYQLLAGMFGRSPTPELRGRLAARFQYSDARIRSSGARPRSSSIYLQVVVEIELFNAGLIAAHGAFVHLELSLLGAKETFVSDRQDLNWNFRRRPGRMTAMAAERLIIAPSEVYTVRELVASYELSTSSRDYSDECAVNVAILCGCEGAVPHRIRLCIPGTKFGAYDTEMQSKEVGELKLDESALREFTESSF